MTIKHNQSKHPLYSIWIAMRQRCMNPRCESYKDYGGRGIKVCEEWNDFAVFLWDMGERPTKAHSIDRYPDNSGNYCKANCRWATAKEQTLNRRPFRWKSSYIEVSGVLRPVRDVEI